MSKLIEQVLEILDIVKGLHKDDPETQTKKYRDRAVEQVANRRGIDNTTVRAKYIRELKPDITNTEDFDRLVDRWRRNGSPELERILQRHSKTDQDRERVRRFFSATQTLHTPVAEDMDEPSSPDRVEQKIYRILRDTARSQQIKEAQQYKCQLCANRLKLSNGKWYAEAHHVKPLGKPHNGPDVGENILCVCPNCHALLDYRSVKLDSSKLKDIDAQYIAYHNNKIYRKWSRVS